MDDDPERGVLHYRLRGVRAGDNLVRSFLVADEIDPVSKEFLWYREFNFNISHYCYSTSNVASCRTVNNVATVCFSFRDKDCLRRVTDCW